MLIFINFILKFLHELVLMHSTQNPFNRAICNSTNMCPSLALQIIFSGGIELRLFVSLTGFLKAIASNGLSFCGDVCFLASMTADWSASVRSTVHSTVYLLICWSGLSWMEDGDLCFPNVVSFFLLSAVVNNSAVSEKSRSFNMGITNVVRY